MADQKAAVAELQGTKRKLRELENLSACRHAIKTYTAETLGKGCVTVANVARARKSRFEVLDRLASLKSGLSAGQKNDFEWFKLAWDKAMVAEHGDGWPEVFMGLTQKVLSDECSTAFSKFVFDETRRVFEGVVALHVPGV